MSSLNSELVALWGRFEEYKSEQGEQELRFFNAIIDYWDKHGIEIEVDRVNRAAEMMMVAVFVMELACKRSTAVERKVDETPKSIVIVDDTDPEVENNNFWMGVELLENGELELWFDIGMLISQQAEIQEGRLDQLPRVSEVMTNSEFVFIGEHACEEYAHMAFDVFKTEDQLLQDAAERMGYGELRRLETDQAMVIILNHATGSEYRGAIWKAWFMRTYLPSFRSGWPRVIREAGKIRRLAVT